MRRSLAFAVLAMLACASAAHGQTNAQTDAPSFEALSRPFLDAADQAAIPACPQADRNFRRIDTKEDAYRLEAEQQGHQQGFRIFHERYEATGCGQPPRPLATDIVTGGQFGDGGRANIGVPGDTAVPRTVALGIIRSVLTVQMAMRHPGCDVHAGFWMSNTAFLSGAVFQPNQSWVERWTYHACGGVDSDDVMFSYDGSGLSYSAVSALSLHTPGNH